MTIPDEMVADLIRCTEQVFETMVFTQAVAADPIRSPNDRPRADVAGMVALTGPINGMVAIYGAESTARIITGSMLGIAPDEVNGELPDAIGEVANMIAGTFRNYLAEQGGQWGISVPAVTVGTSFVTTYRADVEGVLCPFRVEGNDFFVELILMNSNRPNECDPRCLTPGGDNA